MTTLLKAIPNGRVEYATEDARWRAVQERDTNADGKFYSAVTSTGVYCRPSCAARRPYRENVRFFNSPTAAEKAGFRPCKRCQPTGTTLTEDYSARVTAACRMMETAEHAPKLDALAKAAGMSRFHFHRVFTKTTGLTPGEYARSRREERLRTVLPRRGSVTDAIYEAGFNSNSRFYAESNKMLGMKPRHFLHGGAGETIRFAIGQCSLGSILVAASAKGICAISMSEDPEELVKHLQATFPRAQLIGGDKKFERLVARVVAFVEAPNVGLNLPLDVRGTVFQRRVWQALRKIPPGSTASYAEIARRIGAPKAIRAVASACAANAIAVAIPCHRVVRSDGNLSGYRWGVKRKQKLLDSEKVRKDTRPAHR